MELNSLLINEIKTIINSSRKQAYSAVNFYMVQAYYNIGRRIVEEEQLGESKAGYGKMLIDSLAGELIKEFGGGFSATNLKYFRQFYLTFPIHHTVCDELSLQKNKENQVVAIRHTVCDELGLQKNKENQLVGIRHAVSDELPSIIRSELTWTHYRMIMRVQNPKAREYYINECANQGWSSRNLERNIQSFYYERILSSKDQQVVISAANDESRLSEEVNNQKSKIRDFIKDPFVLEFLDLPTNSSYKEKDLENGLIAHLQSFLLELGKGFAFVARQQHIRTEHSDFFIDLVFYNFELKCFVLIDLKTTKLTHQDIGQMDMYVRMYDELKRKESDNPTIGIVLCSESDSVVAKYSVLKGSEQLFASKYSAVLPSEEELKAEIEREIKVIEERIGERGGK